MGRFAPSGFTAAILVLPALALPLCPPPSGATTIVVPDQAPTIQAALNALPDTVVIRPGSYKEAPVVFTPVFLTADSPDPVRRPTLNGMLLQPAPSTPAYTFGFRNIDFGGAVTIKNEYTHCIIDFRLCRLGGGLSDVSSSDRTWDIHLAKCSIVGSVDLYALAACSVDSCDLTGGLKKVVLSTTHLFVTNSTFQSDGSADAAIRADGQRCQVVGNAIRGYGIGMTLRPEYSGVVRGNVVEDCLGVGIALGQTDDAEVTANMVRRCGQGVEVAGGVVLANDNTVESCLAQDFWRGDGMRVGAGYAVVERNVVWGCDGGGLFVEFLAGGASSIANNTSCMNRGSGMTFRLNPLVDGAETEILRNVSAGNGGWGLLWVNPPEGRVSRQACNDWFGNGSGDVGGAPLSVEDFSIDPQFCNAASGDVHLQAGSPLLDAAGCGLIGARGMGCATTATLVALFDAERSPEGVRVRWRLSGSAHVDEIWVERAGAAGGPWTRIVTERAQDGETTIDVDRDVMPEHGYWYRLAARVDGATSILGQPVEIVALAPSAFALAAISPTPTRGSVRVTFDVAHESWIDIDMVDVQGRTVAVLAHGVWPAGRHVIEWPHGGGTQAAGIYFARYRYSGGEGIRKLILTP